MTWTDLFENIYRIEVTLINMNDSKQPLNYE
jgi:hypothetical protein